MQRISARRGLHKKHFNPKINSLIAKYGNVAAWKTANVARVLKEAADALDDALEAHQKELKKKGKGVVKVKVQKDSEWVENTFILRVS